MPRRREVWFLFAAAVAARGRAEGLLEGVDQEIAIKQSIGKLQFGMTIPKLESVCVERNIQILGLRSDAIEQIKGLPKIHGDPFDRLIIAQAQMEDMVIITRDKMIPQYPVRTVW